MISSKRAARTTLHASLVTRNSAKSNLKDFYATEGASGKTLVELEASWLVAKGGTGKGLNELWGSYLASKGFVTVNLKERMKAFFATGTQA